MEEESSGRGCTEVRRRWCVEGNKSPPRNDQKNAGKQVNDGVRSQKGGAGKKDKHKS